MNHSRHILNITATLFAMICFAIGECQAKTSLYSPHDGDLSFIVSNLVIDKNGSDNDSLPRRAQKKSRTKRDSINAAEVKGKADSGEAILTENLANDSTSTDSTIVASNSDYIDFLPGDTIPLTPIKAEKVFEAELETIEIPKKQFIPDPGRALWLSAVFPGAGQIYNKSYWRAPIVVGGLASMVYVIDWNNRGFQRFKTAYSLRADFEHNPDKYPEGVSPDEFKGRYSASYLKNLRDSYRRNRDLSLLLTAGVYIFQAVDAHVDAHLKDFDISDELSVELHPIFDYQHTQINGSHPVFGVNLNITF